MNYTNYTFDNMYDDVKAFNNLAGGNTSHEWFKNQKKILDEEVNRELFPAIDNNDVVNILDGAIDTIYVALGLIQKLEQLGVDVSKACNQVCEDNLMKFPHKLEDAQETVRFYNAKNTNVHYAFNEQYSKYVIKDENGKIRKPHNFVPTDLTCYVPEYLQKRGLV